MTNFDPNTKDFSRVKIYSIDSEKTYGKEMLISVKGDQFSWGHDGSILSDRGDLKIPILESPQVWYLIRRANGNFVLFNAYSKKLAGIAGKRGGIQTKVGTEIEQYFAHFTPDDAFQEWRFELLTDFGPVFAIKSAKSPNMFVGCDGRHCDWDDNKLSLWTDETKETPPTYHQKWRFEEV